MEYGATIINLHDLLNIALAADRNGDGIIDDGERQTLLEEHASSNGQQSFIGIYHLTSEQISDAFCILDSSSFLNRIDQITQKNALSFQGGIASAACPNSITKLASTPLLRRLWVSPSSPTRTSYVAWPEHRYRVALIVNGDQQDQKHSNNVTDMVTNLIALGFPGEQIIVASSRHEGKLPLGVKVIPAAEEDIERALLHLSPAGGETMLFFYTTGHGAEQDGSSVILLERGRTMNTDRLAEKFKLAPIGSLVSVSDQCSSGPFPDQLAKYIGERVALRAMAPVTTPETTECERFIPIFRYGMLIAHDPDFNGEASLAEIFQLALTEYNRTTADLDEPILGSYRVSAPALTAANVIEILNRPGFKIIDLSAPWCKSCQEMEKTIDNFNVFYADEVPLYRLYDASTQAGLKVARRLNEHDASIRFPPMLPTFVYMDGDRVLAVREEKQGLDEILADYEQFFDLKRNAEDDIERVAEHLELAAGVPKDFSLPELQRGDIALEDVEMYYTLLHEENPEKFAKAVESFRDGSCTWQPDIARAGLIAMRPGLIGKMRELQLELIGLVSAAEAPDILTHVVQTSTNTEHIVAALRAAGAHKNTARIELRNVLAFSGNRFPDDDKMQIEIIKSYLAINLRRKNGDARAFTRVYAHASSVDVKAACIIAVGNLASIEGVTIEALSPFLADDPMAHPKLKAAIAEAIGHFAHHQKLGSTSPELGRIIAQLQAELPKADPALRKSTVEILAHAKIPFADQAIELLKATDLDAWEIAHALHGLRATLSTPLQTQHSYSVPLFKLLESPQPDIALTAYATLATYDSTISRRAIARGLAHDDESVRVSILAHLSPRDGERAFLIAESTRLLRDRDDFVRQQALRLLCEIDVDQASKAVHALYPKQTHGALEKDLIRYFKLKQKHGNSAVDAAKAILKEGQDNAVKADALVRAARDPATTTEQLRELVATANFESSRGKLAMIVSRLNIITAQQAGHPQALAEAVSRGIRHAERAVREEALIEAIDGGGAFSSDDLAEAIALGIKPTFIPLLIDKITSTSDFKKDPSSSVPLLMAILENRGLPMRIRALALKSLARATFQPEAFTKLDAYAAQFLKSQNPDARHFAAHFLIDAKRTLPAFQRFAERITTDSDIREQIDQVGYYIVADDRQRAFDLTDALLPRLSTLSQKIALLNVLGKVVDDRANAIVSKIAESDAHRMGRELAQSYLTLRREGHIKDISFSEQ